MSDTTVNDRTRQDADDPMYTERTSAVLTEPVDAELVDAEPVDAELVDDELLVEEISIDGMCGVY